MKINILPFFLLLLLASCNPSDDDNGSSITDEQFAENFGPSALRDFIGQVVDTDNHAVSGAMVSIGSISAQTDVNGIFIINGADVHEKFAYVKVSKSGYLSGSRSLVPTNGKNNIKIMLIAATPTATINSGEVSDVDLPNGTKVTFDGVFETEGGGNYSGNVNVSMFHLETSDENIANLMPGMLYAKGEDGDQKVLRTFGMLNVELRGSAGQKLNIAAGHKAGISMKIDDSQMATAPQSIPLWHFDEAVGYWKQDGEATRQGGFYVGEVSHFSWWNCDAWDNTINMTVNIKDSAGNALPNVSVRITAQGRIAESLTDSQGAISGMVPVDIPMNIEVLNVCGNVIATGPVGALSADTVLPDIIITPGQSEIKTVLGSLKKCDDSNVTNGYVLLNYAGNVKWEPVTDGDFSCQFLVCSTEDAFTAQGYDFDSDQTTGLINYRFVAQPSLSIGDLRCCSDITEFISYDFDGQHYFLRFINTGQINDSATYLYTIRGQEMPNANTGVHFYSNVTTPGTYSYSSFHPWISVGNTTYQCSGLFPGNTVQIVLSHCGAVGEYIDFTFEGSFHTGVNGVDTHVITGIAHVIRRPQP